MRLHTLNIAGNMRLSVRKIAAVGAPIMRQSANEPEKPKKPKTGREKYSAEKSKEDEAKAPRPT